MNRAVQYPFFPIVDRFNTQDSIPNIIVNNLEQVLPLFPSEIVIDTLENDFVFTTRYEKGGGSEDDTLITFIGNKFFSKLGNILFSLRISDILYTYLIGKTSSFNLLNIKSNDFTFCVELPIKMELQKMKYKCLPSFEKKRIAGKKKVNAFIDGFLILLEMIKLFINFKIFRNKVID